MLALAAEAPNAAMATDPATNWIASSPPPEALEYAIRTGRPTPSSARISAAHRRPMRRLSSPVATRIAPATAHAIWDPHPVSGRNRRPFNAPAVANSDADSA